MKHVTNKLSPSINAFVTKHLTLWNPSISFTLIVMAGKR